MKKWVSLCVYCPATPRATTPCARRRVDDELDELSRETKKYIDATNIPLDTFFESNFNENDIPKHKTRNESRPTSHAREL